MSESTTVAIAGGGPAGVVLGLLLARAGVEVTVLEKHEDFLRDFRGDTVDEESEAFRADLPPLGPGTYGVSAIVPFTPEDGGAPQYAGGPLATITLQ